jgi:cytochrome P450
MLTTIFYCFLAFIIFVVYRFFIKPYRIYRYYRNQGLPGYFFPLIGFLKESLANFKKHGDIMANYRVLPKSMPKCELYISNFGDRCAIQVLDAALLKEFYANQDHFEKIKPSLGMRRMTGRGILALEGDEWKRRRKIISTMFHFNFINENLPLIYSTTREFLDEMKAGSLKDMKIMDEVQKITGEIVGRIFFGNNLNQYKVDGEVLTLHLAELIGETSAAGSTVSVVFLGFLGLGPQIMPSYQKILAKVDRFRSICLKIVTDRKASKTKTNDLLGLLLDYQEKNKDTENALSDTDIVDEFITFFTAGMDTTGHMIAMAIYLLSKNPQYLPRLEAELKTVNLQESTITNEIVNKLEFHTCVLKETLRFYTPAPGLFPRYVNHDFMLGKYKILKGTSVRPNFIYNFSHQDYFEDPEAFKPERWENPKINDTFAYVPFSAGQRNCIGQHLAMIEGRIILSEFLRMFKYTIPQDYEAKMMVRFLYEPANKISVDLEPRV